MSPTLPSSAGILTINAGSSSIKFAHFRGGQSLLRTVSGKVERIGLPGTELTLTEVASQHAERTPIHAADHAGCLDPVMEALEKKGYLSAIQGVGHRVVHGGDRYSQPTRVTPDVLAELRRLSPYDPEHLPAEANGRVVLAHLGNGASLAAVRGGRSLDTTMGFTPTAGVPMSTRSGDLDPGIVAYLARTEGMSVEEILP